MTYTPAAPCRCGFSGSGRHRCHAGRPDPATGEDGSRWCPRDAVDLPIPERIVARPPGLYALAGVQIKIVAAVYRATIAHYCPEHTADLLPGLARPRGAPDVE